MLDKLREGLRVKKDGGVSITGDLTVANGSLTSNTQIEDKLIELANGTGVLYGDSGIVIVRDSVNVFFADDLMITLL